MDNKKKKKKECDKIIDFVIYNYVGFLPIAHANMSMK